MLVASLTTEDRPLSINLLENTRLEELPSRLGLVFRLFQLKLISDIERGAFVG